MMLQYEDRFIFTLVLLSHITTACHFAVAAAEEHLDSLLKSLVKEPLSNLNTDESLNDASSTHGASNKTDGEFFLHLISWYIQCYEKRFVLQAVHLHWHLSQRLSVTENNLVSTWLY
jgi:hypothetical protein